MWPHLGHFIGSIFGIFFSTIGTTPIGWGIDGAFAASVAIAALHKKRKSEGWPALLKHFHELLPSD